MNVQPLISVIMPVYNTLQYLDRSLQSLTTQTHRNLDIVVIDDGSTDGSAKILDAWKDRDSRIRVVHQPNMGVAAARNRGLDEARGTMIAWLDSDDWIEPGYLQGLAEAKRRTGADIAENFCGGRNRSERLAVIEGDDIIRDFLLIRLSGMLWTTLTDVSKYKGLRFLNTSVGEDAYMLLQVRSRCSREVVCQSGGYHYTIRSDSAVRQFNINKYDAWIESLNARIDFIFNNYPNLCKYMSYQVIYDSLLMLHTLWDERNVEGVDTIESRIRQMVLENIFHIPYFQLRPSEIKNALSAAKFLLTAKI